MSICQSESLDHLLASLRQRQSPLLPISSLFALYRGDVIEIQGSACSGKTHLLYYLLLSLLVPVPASPVSQIAAIVYDTDASFDILRFRRLLLSRTTSTHPALDPHETVQRSLARLHLFRPTSPLHLAASIANLPAYHSSRMPNQEIAFLAIDSISTFYWADRFATEQSRHVSPEKVNAAPLHHVWNALQNVWRSHRPLTVLTSWALNNSAPSHPGSPYKQYLHPFPVLDDRIADADTEPSGNIDRPFSSPFRLAHHITLSSPSSHRFPPLLGNAPPIKICHTEGITGIRQVLGLTRSSGTRSVLSFTLEIADADILVRSQESPEPS